MVQSFPYKPNSCGSFKVCPPKNLGKQFFNIILDSVDQIPFPLKANAIYFVRDGVAFDMYEVNDAGTELIARPFLTQNIRVENIVEGEIIPHGLNTKKLEYSFWDIDEMIVENIKIRPLTNSTFEVYGPVLESGSWSFSGDIYLKRRA